MFSWKRESCLFPKQRVQVSLMPNVYSSCSVSLAISFFRGTARNILTHFRAFITSKPLMIQSICGASLEIPANCTDDLSYLYMVVSYVLKRIGLKLFPVDLQRKAYHGHLTPSPSPGVGNLTLEPLWGVGNLTQSRGRWEIWPFVHDEQRENVKRFSGNDIAFMTEWLSKNGP